MDIFEMWKIFTLEIPLAVELRKKKADGRKTETIDVATEDAARVHVIRGTFVKGMQTEEKWRRIEKEWNKCDSSFISTPLSP